MLPKKILFCTDFSKNSEPACRCALEYAKAFGAAVSIVHVIATWPVHAYKDKLPVDEVEVAHCLRGHILIDLEELSRQFIEVLGDVTTCVRIGAPAREIIRYADEESADLIVMGTHGWSGFVHAMLGSIAEAVIRTANCPVMIVRSVLRDTGHAEKPQGTVGS